MSGSFDSRHVYYFSLPKALVDLPRTWPISMFAFDVASMRFLQLLSSNGPPDVL